MTYKQKLANNLSYINENQGIVLGDDTFLCGDLLDGSDKIYGFAKRDDEIIVITRQSSGGYPINQMNKNDLGYLMTSGIGRKIKNKEYSICDLEEI